MPRFFSSVDYLDLDGVPRVNPWPSAKADKLCPHEQIQDGSQIGFAGFDLISQRWIGSGCRQ